MTKAYNPRKSREEWKQIITDKEVNKLSVSQVASMYSVSEGNVYQWISNFKKEHEEMLKTESHVKDFIQKSIDDLKKEKGVNLDHIGDLQNKNTEIGSAISRLEKSLKALQWNEIVPIKS